MTRSTAVHLLNQEVIKAYLGSHQSDHTPLIVEKVGLVAVREFANRTIPTQEIPLHIKAMFCFYHELRLSEKELVSSPDKLSNALTDCAKECNLLHPSI
ncbi:MAG: hypothetical protein JWO53_1253 [Chlamydiia bacterium]|nr:hypothetical protein [Chlamydiia bacterium]